MDVIVPIGIIFGLYTTQAAGWLFTNKRVCYGTLGCFSSSYPFTNTKGLLPRPPEVIGTKFHLFSRTYIYEELVLTDQHRKRTWKSFWKLKQTKFIIHGYMDSVDTTWIKDMVKALLEHGDYNVIVVDWSDGAREINYLQAVANTRVVGVQVAQLLKVLRNVYGIEPVNAHIIGHSLGAHAAGYAGEYLEDIGRISGLDPAGPAFEKTDPIVRLDSTDAIFVDVIHTDAEHIFSLGFGLKQPIGTVDFYPNEGRDQPGCPTTYFAQIRLLVSGNSEFACSHLRSRAFFTESINSKCNFTAYPCEYINPGSSKNCTPCESGCGMMGFHANPSMNLGMYYLQTNPNEPFCIQ